MKTKETNYDSRTGWLQQKKSLEAIKRNLRKVYDKWPDKDSRATLIMPDNHGVTKIAMLSTLLSLDDWIQRAQENAGRAAMTMKANNGKRHEAPQFRKTF